MSTVKAFVAVIIAAVVCIHAAGASAAAFNLSEVRRGVVYVKWIERNGLELASGSGFLATADGFVYTNRHVARPKEIDVSDSLLLVGVPSAKDPEVLDLFSATVAYAAPETVADFAILKITPRAGYGPLHPLHLAAHPAELGDSVAALGFPGSPAEDPTLTFTRGVVSATRARLANGTFWQTDAAINPGNSGGPLINEAGEVVGMATQIFRPAQGIGYSLLLSQLENPADAERELGDVRAQLGPLESYLIPQPRVVPPTRANWDVGGGHEELELGELTIDNNGDSYWLVSKQPLPKNFKVQINCGLSYLLGDEPPPVHESNARSLFIRFGSSDNAADIKRRGSGYLIQLSRLGLHLAKDHDVVSEGRARVGEDEALPTMVLERNGGHITFGTTREPDLLEYDDPTPIADSGMLNIGGMLSKMALGKIVVADLDANGGTKAAGKP